MLPPQSLYHFVPCAVSYLFAEIKHTSLKLFPGILGFTSPKTPPTMMQARTLLTPTAAAIKHNVAAQKRRSGRRHVVMINQSRVRRAGENWCRPTWDCQGCGVRWVQAPSAVRAQELSGDSPDSDQLTNQDSLPPHRPISVFSACRVTVHHFLWQILFPFPRQLRSTFFFFCKDAQEYIQYLSEMNCFNVRKITTDPVCTTQFIFFPQVIARLVTT